MRDKGKGNLKYRVAQKSVHTLWHEKWYSIIVTAVFIQKKNWYEGYPWIINYITLSPWNINSNKFIPKILMSKECIHFLGHSVCA